MGITSKHYHYDSQKEKFVVSRRINGKKLFFGYYKTERAAKLAVKLFQQYGWNKSNNWLVKAKVKEQLGESQ